MVTLQKRQGSSEPSQARDSAPSPPSVCASDASAIGCGFLDAASVVAVSAASMLSHSAALDLTGLCCDTRHLPSPPPSAFDSDGLSDDAAVARALGRALGRPDGLPVVDPVGRALGRAGLGAVAAPVVDPVGIAVGVYGALWK